MSLSKFFRFLELHFPHLYWFQFHRVSTSRNELFKVTIDGTSPGQYSVSVWGINKFITSGAYLDFIWLRTGSADSVYMLLSEIIFFFFQMYHLTISPSTWGWAAVTRQCLSCKTLNIFIIFMFLAGSAFFYPNATNFMTKRVFSYSTALFPYCPHLSICARF